MLTTITTDAQGLANATYRSGLLLQLATDAGLSVHDRAVLCDVPDDEARSLLEGGKTPAHGPAVALAARFGRDVREFFAADAVRLHRRRFHDWRTA